ncbi:MAG: TldD/PmbA family protein [Defluviitaleaceae bacterium]|nr:TldD/PmbA family protein [Defluviitaleaceae bacterium]
MIDIARHALDKAKNAGADKVSCSVQQTRKDEFNVEANKFSLLRTLFDDELNLKVIIGGRKGTISINKLDMASVEAAVDECMAMAASATPDEAEDIAPLVENKKFSRNIGGADMEKLFARTQEFIQHVKDAYPQVSVDMQAVFISEKSVYLNSNGVEFHDEGECYYIQPMFGAKEGEASSSFNFYGAMVTDLDTPFMDWGMLRTLIEDAPKSIKTRMVDDKYVGKIIMTPACDDMVWYTLLWNFLDASSLISGTSRWKDALDTQVADKKLTMRAVPLHPDIVSAERYTDDGFESKDFDFIKDGVLKSFALPLYAANKTGKPRAENTAFYNLEIEAGDVSLADMIKSVDKGILVNRFSGASPGPSGDISGVAKNSFLIENGKITDAISETMISFNIVDILQNIPAISKERCKNGSSILPWFCFDGVTVSGK